MPEILEGPLPCILYERGQRTPDRIFLEAVEGGNVTYCDFIDRVGRFVAAFSSLGVEKETRVAALVPQSIDAHAVWQAVAWMGGWEVPINNEFHGDMLAYVLNDCEASHIVVTAEFLPAIISVASQLAHLREVLVIGETHGASSIGLSITSFDEQAPPDKRVKEKPVLGDGDVATVIYTSGTTGPSKGVILPWGEFYTAREIYGCRQDGSDALYTPFPTNHMSGKVPIYDMAAFAGRAVLRRRFSTSEFWRDVRSHRCTGTILLGGTAVFLNNEPPSPEDKTHSMHTVVMVPVMEEYRSFEERFGLSIMTIYGMSECGFPFMSPSGGLVNADSCGRLRNGWHVRIVDGDDQDVPVGEAGELLVKCDQPSALMIGYLGRPEATAEAMRGGWFHTGDAFRADSDGNYYFVDRIKDAIRRRGENISSFEVEAFVRRFPGISECAAVAAPSETGEDEIKVSYTVRDGESVDVEALARFCKARMPAFMTPRYFEEMQALPYTPTNKIKKAALRSAGVETAWDRLKNHDAVNQKASADARRV